MVGVVSGVMVVEAGVAMAVVVLVLVVLAWVMVLAWVLVVVVGRANRRTGAVRATGCTEGYRPSVRR